MSLIRQDTMLSASSLVHNSPLPGPASFTSVPRPPKRNRVNTSEIGPRSPSLVEGRGKARTAWLPGASMGIGDSGCLVLTQ